MLLPKAVLWRAVVMSLLFIDNTTSIVLCLCEFRLTSLQTHVDISCLLWLYFFFFGTPLPNASSLALALCSIVFQFFQWSPRREAVVSVELAS